jgi:hypothetical protein
MNEACLEWPGKSGLQAPSVPAAFGAFRFRGPPPGRAPITPPGPGAASGSRRLNELPLANKTAFDTILILGRGLGMVETLAGLDKFLEDTHRHLLPKGQVLVSSLDVRWTANPVHLSYQNRPRESERYVGELRMQFEYEGQAGPMFSFCTLIPTHSLLMPHKGAGHVRS